MRFTLETCNYTLYFRTLYSRILNNVYGTIDFKLFLAEGGDNNSLNIFKNITGDISRHEKLMKANI